MAAYRGKRFLDLAICVPMLLLSAPVQAGSALAIWARMGRPILFRQGRPGLHGEPFELVKFRTMLPIDPERGLVEDSDRLTRLGAFLRSTSLDELPTLWNVVRGDMSIVGPRPLLMHYLELYTPEQARRHDVRPGLTGLAQINGRNALTWQEKFRYDVDYVDNNSFMGDIRIVLLTVAQVVRRHGISAVGSATMPEFTGSSS